MNPSVSDETTRPRPATRDTPQDLLERVLARDNLQRAWKRVKANRGAAGVDGLDIARAGAHLKTAWPTIRDQLCYGQYRPQPVRRITIPQASGGQRKLGIPTVTDRLIQQALLQVMQPLIDPTFQNTVTASGRAAAHMMPCATHSIMCKRATKSLSMWTWKASLTTSTTTFWWQSWVATSPTDVFCVWLARISTRINETKTTIRSAFGAAFLGYALWQAPNGEVKFAVAATAIKAYKRCVKQLTHRHSGRSLLDIIATLRPYVRGWKAYFRLAQTPRVWIRLDQWLRHRLRAIQLKHWGRGAAIHRAARTLGAPPLRRPSVPPAARVTGGGVVPLH